MGCEFHPRPLSSQRLTGVGGDAAGGGGVCCCRSRGAALPRHQSALCTGACCHGGAKMAVLAYSLGKREINQHFTVKNAKLISLALVLVLLLSHSLCRYYGGLCP